MTHEVLSCCHAVVVELLGGLGLVGALFALPFVMAWMEQTPDPKQHPVQGRRRRRGAN